MNLSEQIENKLAFGKNGKGRMRYKRFLKKQNRRIWRRFKSELKPLYGRYFKWEY